MTRVGVLTSSFPSRPGDPAGSFVAEHARYLRGAGCDVEVVAARPGSPDAVPGIRVSRLTASGARLFAGAGAPELLTGARHSAARHWRDATGASLAMLAAALRRRRRWDRLIAHWLVPAGIAAALAAGGRPVRAIAHSGDVHLLRRLGLTSAAAAVFASAGARLSFVSESLRSSFLRDISSPWLRRRTRAASTVVPMGVDVNRLRAARREAQPARERRYVAYLGRLVEVKGPDIAAGAAGAWRAPVPLIMAGAGPMAGRLRAQREREAPGRVTLCGELRGWERDRFVAGAAALVIPSRVLPDGRSEGLPVAALEAMAAGVPVIATDVGGLADLPTGAVTRVKPDDPSALARAVDRVWQRPIERQRQIAAAATFVERLDWRLVGPRLW